MLRYLGALVLGVSLLGSVAVAAADDHDRAVQRHEWNDHENQYWHQYLKEHRRKDHEWEKATKKEQRNYWKWRDSHPDAR